jgi:hypothetical protein
VVAAHGSVGLLAAGGQGLLRRMGGDEGVAAAPDQVLSAGLEERLADLEVVFCLKNCISARCSLRSRRLRAM